MDVQFLKPFIEGTINTLRVQCQTEALPTKPYFKTKDHQNLYEIAGVIGLSSNVFRGTIAVCFPKDVFLLVMSRMLGENFTEITDDLQDGVSELLNIIFGHAKRVLNDNGEYKLEKAIPTVVRGSAIQITHLSNSPVVVLPFMVEEKSFAIEICTEKDS